MAHMNGLAPEVTPVPRAVPDLSKRGFAFVRNGTGWTIFEGVTRRAEDALREANYWARVSDDVAYVISDEAAQPWRQRSERLMSLAEVALRLEDREGRK